MKSDEFMNRFLDDFVKWRKEKGYEDLLTLSQKYSQKEVESRFWKNVEDYKKDRQIDG